MLLSESRFGNRPITALLLAGRIRPSPMLDAFGLHELCLPIGTEGKLLDAWLRKLAEIPNLSTVRVIVNTSAEVTAVESSMGINDAEEYGFDLSIMAEQSAWRGAGGIVRDAIDARSLSDDCLVLICEAKRLPPRSLRPIISAKSEQSDLSGAVGVCGNSEPAGLYLFTAGSLKLIPAVGYFDLKEQFLPALARRNCGVVSVPMATSAYRIADAESYLAAVKHSLNGSGGEAHSRISSRASVSSSAIVNGHCVIEAGAVIEDGAVLHDSVVLWGATIGGGAVVSRSVIGPLSAVQPRSRVLKQLFATTRVNALSETDAMREFVSLDRLAGQLDANRLSAEAAQC